MPNVQHVRFHIQRVNKSETGSVLPVQRNGKGHVDEKEDQDTELVHTGIVFLNDNWDNEDNFTMVIYRTELDQDTNRMLVHLLESSKIKGQ